MAQTLIDDRQVVQRAALSSSIGSSAGETLDSLMALIDSKMVNLAGTQTLSNKTLSFLQTSVLTDSTTTGSAATLQSADIVAGIVRLTNTSLVSVSGIPAGASGQYITIENQTGNSLTVNNNDSGASSGNRILTGTGGPVTMSANQTFELIYDATAAIWLVVGGTGSGSGSGGGKNYLSVYSASTGGDVPNVGNGNFELGSTTGFSLAHVAFSTANGYFQPTGTATAGTPFSASAGGSAANANLSLSVISSGQLAGTYSGNLASSATSIQGDLLISSAFNIDLEDQAKVMTVKAYYEANVAGGLNFSGTSANGFALWIYDVTNGAWIMPAGTYGMTQNAGAGYVTATFQTTSNSTQYQFALININASISAYSLYLDDISVGPQTAPLGAVVTDWQGYTLTIGATTTAPTPGTNTNSAQWRRVGDSMEITYTYAQTASGSAGSGTYLFPLPSGYSVDTTKVAVGTGAIGAANNILGSGQVSTTAAASIASGLFASVYAYNTQNLFIVTGASSYGELSAVGSSNFQISSSGAYYAFTAKVPITGWSSNVQMSNDTDTRVIVAQATNAGLTTTTNAAIPMTATNWDNSGSITLATGRFTAPISGYYNVQANVSKTGGASGSSIVLYKNNVLYYTLFSFFQSSTTGVTNGSTVAQLNAGDFIDIRCDASIAVTAISFTISRISGPSVIAATESVNMRYISTAGTTINNTSPVIPFPTKDFDSHNAYNTSTGVYTVPVSGKYSITVGVIVYVDLATDQTMNVSVLQNGSIYSYLGGFAGTGVAVYNFAGGTDTVNCLAGDTLSITCYSDVSSTLTTTVGYNHIAIERIGN